MNIKLAVDFDGTIVDWKFPDIGPLKYGVIEALRELKKFCDITIYSSRANQTLTDRRKYLYEMKEFLDRFGVPYDRIDTGIEGKVIADFYIDDRAIEFKDDWLEVVVRIREAVGSMKPRTDLTELRSQLPVYTHCYE